MTDKPKTCETSKPDDHDLVKIEYTAGHTGCLFRCKNCGKYTFRGEPNEVRN